MSFLFQASPEAYEERPDLDEALRFHGLTRERMTAEMIRWLESIRLESPEAYDFFVSDPPLIAQRIIQWDFVFSTGMTTEYPKRRNWNHWMALREFIQNALDIEEKMYGYENISIRVFADALGIHVIDRGPGITLEAFRLGGSDKACHERGYFGEGLKVAGAHFVASGVPVYVFNRKGQAFKMCVSPGTDLVVVVLGRTSLPPEGTEVILVGARMAEGLLEQTVFQEWLKKHPEAHVLCKVMMGISECPTAKPNFVITSAENINLLWVRDIFVNQISNITSKEAIYGYNLWWIPLEPNRVSVSNLSELYKQVARVFTPEVIEDLLDRVVDKKERRITGGYFETDQVDWWYASDDLKDKVAEWVETHRWGIVDEEKEVDWFMYMGVRPLYVPTHISIRNLFTHAKTADEIAVEKGIERLEKAKKTSVPEEMLTLKELRYIGATRAILSFVHHQVFWTEPMPEITVALELAEAGGTQIGDKLYIRRDKLSMLESTFKVLAHEYAHYFAERRYGEYRDLSEGFERALTDIYGYISLALRDRITIGCYRRALTGAWRAQPYKWEKGKVKVKKPLLDEIMDIIREETATSWAFGEDWGSLERVIDETAPAIISIDLSYPPYRPKDFHLSFERVTHIIPDSVPPNRELYFREAKKIAEEKHAETLNRGIVLIYDPWQDTYVLYRKVGL